MLLIYYNEQEITPNKEFSIQNVTGAEVEKPLLRRSHYSLFITMLSIALTQNRISM